MTTTVTSFPHAVREVDPVWIPLADGTRLAATVWLPADADSRPVPAVLEYLPYRRRDFTAQRDALMPPPVPSASSSSARRRRWGSTRDAGARTG